MGIFCAIRNCRVAQRSWHICRTSLKVAFTVGFLTAYGTAEWNVSRVGRQQAALAKLSQNTCDRDGQVRHSRTKQGGRELKHCKIQRLWLLFHSRSMWLPAMHVSWLSTKTSLGSQQGAYLGSQKQHVLALSKEHVSDLNKEHVLALNKDHVLTLNREHALALNKEHVLALTRHMSWLSTTNRS